MFNRKLKVVMYINHEEGKNNACTLYRNINPMSYAKRWLDIRYIHKVETEIQFDPVRRQVQSIAIDSEPIEWADVVVFSRHYDQRAVMGSLVEVAEKMGKVVVYETDDLLQRVEQNIGDNSFDSKNYRYQLKFVNWLIERADLMTVTVPYLKKFYEEMGAKNVAQLPNCYDPKQWRGLYFYKRMRDIWRRAILGRKTIRVGWQGGNNHFLNNFQYLIEPLNQLKKKYGVDFQFVVMSGKHPNVELNQTKSGKKRKTLDFDFEYREGVPVEKFPRALAEMDLDIGLIVVEDNEFSRGKSNIKWMEYALVGVPAVSSRCEPYLDTNAILVENTTQAWIDGIERLILDEAKRDMMTKEAKKMVSRLNIKKRARDWVNAYRDALQAKIK